MSNSSTAAIIGNISFNSRPPAARSMVEQAVAAGRGVEQPALIQHGEPALLDAGEEPQRSLPVPGKIAHQIQHRLPQQVFRSHVLDQQPIHRRPGFARQPQQRRPAGGGLAKFLRDDPRQREHPVQGIDRRRHIVRTQRIEQGAERLVEIEVAHHRHARHQQPGGTALARVAHERFGDGATRAAAGDEQGQSCKTKAGVLVTRHQPGDQRVGEPAMRRDRIDLRHPARSRRAVSHPAAPVPWGRYAAACRPRTIARKRPFRTGVLPRSRGPTGCWLRTCPAAHRAAGGG